MLPIALAILAMAFFYVAMSLDEEQQAFKIIFVFSGLLMSMITTQIVVGTNTNASPALELVTWVFIIILGVMGLYIIWDFMRVLSNKDMWNRGENREKKKKYKF